MVSSSIRTNTLKALTMAEIFPSNKQKSLLAHLRWLATENQVMLMPLAAAIVKPGMQTGFGTNDYRTQFKSNLLGNQRCSNQRCSAHAEINAIHKCFTRKTKKTHNTRNTSKKGVCHQQQKNVSFAY